MKWLLLASLIVSATLSVVVSRQMFPAGKSEVAGGSFDQVDDHSPATVQGIGYVEPVSEVRKLMFRTSGVIRSCSVHAGLPARMGDVLAELDNSTHRADVELARKQLEQARADAVFINAGINPYRIKVVEQTVERLREKFRFNQSETARFRRLVATRSASQQELDAIETQRWQSEVELREQEAELVHLRNHVTPENRALQEAKVRQAEANLRLAEERFQETRLTAPIAGTVLKLLKREGEAVSTLIPEAVMLFGDLSKLRVRAEIDERFVHQLEVGQQAEVFGRNLAGKSSPGRVVQLEKIMGDKTVFARSAAERKNLEVLQALVEMGPEFRAPAGLQVDVKIVVPGSESEARQP